jgi:uncharacterized coiled-coil protein SlyX
MLLALSSKDIIMNTDIGAMDSPNKTPSPSSSPVASTNFFKVGDGEVKIDPDPNIGFLPGIQIKIPRPGTPTNELGARVARPRTPAGEFDIEIPHPGTPTNEFDARVARPRTPAGEFDIEIPRPGTPANEFDARVPLPEDLANKFNLRIQFLENLTNELNVEVTRSRTLADESNARVQNLVNKFNAEIQRLRDYSKQI